MIKHRFETLDSLRGLAALAVVLYHYTHQYYKLFPTDYIFIFDFSLGYFGVQAFFIISGFVIFMTLERTKKPMDFIVSRFARLYPIYWIAILLTFLIVSYFGLENQEVTIKEFFFNFTMIQGQFKIPSVVSIFMVIFTILFYYIGDSIFILKLFYIVFILQYLGFFIAGIMFYKLYTHKSNKLTYLVLFLTYVSNILLIQEDITKIYLTSFIYLVFILLVIQKLNWLQIKPLIFLGTISYPLYLIHQNIGYVIIQQGFKNNLNIEIVTLFAIFITLIIATFMTFLVEKPMVGKIRELYKSYKEKKSLQ